MYMGATLGIPLANLPSKKLYGWPEFAATVDEARASLPEDIVLAADYYGTASSLTYHLKGKPFVYLFTDNSRRLNQYDIWQKVETWQSLRGRDFFIATEDQSDLESLRDYFSSTKVVAIYDFLQNSNTILNVSKLKDSSKDLSSRKKLKIFYLIHAKSFSGKIPSSRRSH